MRVRMKRIRHRKQVRVNDQRTPVLVSSASACADRAARSLRRTVGQDRLLQYGGVTENPGCALFENDLAGLFLKIHIFVVRVASISSPCPQVWTRTINCSPPSFLDVKKICCPMSFSPYTWMPAFFPSRRLILDQTPLAIQSVLSKSSSSQIIVTLLHGPGSKQHHETIKDAEPTVDGDDLLGRLHHRFHRDRKMPATLRR